MHDTTIDVFAQILTSASKPRIYVGKVESVSTLTGPSIATASEVMRGYLKEAQRAKVRKLITLTRRLFVTIKARLHYARGFCVFAVLTLERKAQSVKIKEHFCQPLVKIQHFCN